MPQRGDIVLVPVPFTDLSSNRRRPVIVISNDDYQKTTQDMIVVAMTSFGKVKEDSHREVFRRRPG